MFQNTYCPETLINWRPSRRQEGVCLFYKVEACVGLGHVHNHKRKWRVLSVTSQRKGAWSLYDYYFWRSKYFSRKSNSFVPTLSKFSWYIWMFSSNSWNHINLPCSNWKHLWFAKLEFADSEMICFLDRGVSFSWNFHLWGLFFPLLIINCSVS